MNHLKHLKSGVIFTAFVMANLVISASSQSQNLDSLENVLRARKISVSGKIKTCDDLSWGLLSIDVEKSKKYAKQGISLAVDSKDKKMEATLYRNLGVAYYMNSQFDTAHIYLNKALDMSIKSKDDKLEALVYGAIGNIYNVQGEYQKSISYYLKALPLFEKQGEKDRMQMIYGNLGTLFMSLKNTNEAEKYFRKSEKISSEIKSDFGLGQSYDGLSRVFLEKNKIDSALVYGKKAIFLFEKMGDKYNQSTALNTVAMIYYSHFKNYVLAKEYANKAYNISVQLNIPTKITGALNMLSNISFNNREYEQCIVYASQAIKTDTTDVNVLTNLYANMTRSYIWTGNKQQANNYFDKYRLLIDKKANEEYQQTLTEMQTKYETAKKDGEIYKLSVQKKEKNRLIYLLLFAMLILFFLIFLIYKDRRKSKIISGQTLKMKEQQITEMEKERQLIVAKSVLEGEETERARLANDLHDGLGGLLSGVKLNLSSMKENNILTVENTVAFNNTLGLLDNSIKELRRIAHNLMPENLMRFGLKYAISEFIASLNNAENAKISFAFYGEETRYTKELELSVYRITQELVNNALKYSKATDINVQLILENERINMQVIDNGAGFDTSIIDISTKGTGLQQIKNRVNALNGKFEINSSPNEGTEVYIEFSSI